MCAKSVDVTQVVTSRVITRFQLLSESIGLSIALNCKAARAALLVSSPISNLQHLGGLGCIDVADALL